MDSAGGVLEAVEEESLSTPCNGFQGTRIDFGTTHHPAPLSTPCNGFREVAGQA